MTLHPQVRQIFDEFVSVHGTTTQCRGPLKVDLKQRLVAKLRELNIPLPLDMKQYISRNIAVSRGVTGWVQFTKKGCNRVDNGEENSRSGTRLKEYNKKWNPINNPINNPIYLKCKVDGQLKMKIDE